MNVTYLSTYPPAPCGIGDYTRELRLATEQADPALKITVAAERHRAVKQELDARVDRLWQRGAAWAEEAAAAIIQTKPAVVHIQHEEAILGQDGTLPRFLRALGAAGIRRVVTLHSVYGGRLGVPFWWPPPLFHRALAAQADALVVHQNEGGRDFLERQGVPASLIHVIPHGTPHLPREDRATVRRRLGIPTEDRVALFFGVIHPKKNLHTVVEAARRARARLPGLRLVVAGEFRTRNLLDRRYEQRLTRALQPGIGEGWVDFRRGFLPSGEIPAFLAAADVVLFPHHQSYGSASGVFHLALAAGRTAICSSSLKFSEAREIFAAALPGAIVPAKDVDRWADALVTILGDPALCRRGEEIAVRAATATAWPVLGHTYAQLYRTLAGAPPR